MRTTVEITNPQRARLMDLAARRGLKGFSSIVQDALDLYLAQTDRREQELRAALAIQGVLTEDEAGELANRAASIRGNWR